MFFNTESKKFNKTYRKFYQQSSLELQLAMLQDLTVQKCLKS